MESPFKNLYFFAFVLVALSIGILEWRQVAPLSIKKSNESTRTVAISDPFLRMTFAGYQGWFGAEGDGVLGWWSHWTKGGIPSPGNVTFELYPDVSDYPSDTLFDTELILPNGNAGKLFSSSKLAVTDLHFKWMSEYEIDGVALQRFVVDISYPAVKKHFDTVAKNVRTSAEKYNKKFYTQYDISGCASWEICATIIKEDIFWIESELVVSPSYARNGNDRPVIGLWGVGFREGVHPGTTEQVIELVSFLKQRGFVVLGGVPYGWRTEDRDSKPNFLKAYLTFDIIQPWSVGRFKNETEVDADAKDRLKEDIRFTTSLGIGYQRPLFAGFAWSNWNGGPKNEIPRMGGDFYWHQAYHVYKAGASSYIAMFDEYDEGTAIAKAAKNSTMIPTNQHFLSLDADELSLPSDHYLWLAGQAAAMFKGEIEPTSEQPVRIFSPQ